ncbi:MAG: type II secretion system protein GspM [Pseudomonadales bacterium]
MDKLNLEWFFALQWREQYFLVFGVIALSLYLFFIAIWKPISAENESLRERNKAQAESLQWMRSSAAFIKQQKSSGQSASSGQRSISQLLNASVAGGGLKFSRFQPRGNDKAQVWFENTSFSSLFLWLTELQRENVLVNNVSISSTSQGGLVSASLQLQKVN